MDVFVLLVYFGGTHRTAIISQEYVGYRACIEAANTFKKSVPDYYDAPITVCTPKGPIPTRRETLSEKGDK